jgi:hypothetical protein
MIVALWVVIGLTIVVVGTWIGVMVISLMDRHLD